MEKEYTKEEISKLPFMDSTLDIEKRVDNLLGILTLKEKLKLCAGRRMWDTKPIKRLGIKSFVMHDGPHGLRVDEKGVTKCTYFPSGICRAATWNPELSRGFGMAIAQEVRDVGAHMILAPGINIQRSPMCGRTFEYQTEDPYLNKILAVETVKGMQSQKIAACVKHFICNNQETKRHTVSSEVSERALQEIYFPAFKATVQEADAWSFMSCYNKVNGTWGSEHEKLIKETLMEKWGFRGFVVTDWGATHSTKTEGCVKAGLTLEMPMAKNYRLSKLKKGLEKQLFSEENINDNVKRLLRVMFLVGFFDDESSVPAGSRNTPEHQAVARKTAEEGIVLLKNENNLLPLNANQVKKIAIIGPNANLMTSKGGGSSTNFPPHEITPLEGLKEKCENKIEIVDSPQEADVTILITGLSHKPNYDCEGMDKVKFELSATKLNRINKTIQENPNTVVVLINGSPISMVEWIDKVPAVVEAWYGGMEAGRAIADVLFGDVNPSGKLTITFPKSLSDVSAHASERTFPGDDKVYYDEGIFVGYRHFDTKNIDPLFPFGYGLSYTTFNYDNLKFSTQKVSKGEKITVTAEITNTGQRDGAEVVQLYVQDVECSVERPLKELKGFQKIFLKPSEMKTVNIELDQAALSFFDEKDNCWKAEKGLFKILIGSSSRDIRLQGEIEYMG